MGLLAIAWLGSGCGDGDRGDTAVATGNPVQTFAPLVRLHPRERIYPTRVDSHLGRATLRWAEDSGCADPIVAEHVDRAKLGDGRYRQRAFDTRCRERGNAYATDEPTHPYVPERGRDGLAEGEGFYLDAAGGRSVAAELDERGRIPRTTPTYYDVASATVDGDPGLRISYWSFFERGVGTWVEWWDDKKGGRYWGRDRIARSGDWERVDVVARRAGDHYAPVALRTYTEAGHRDTPWSDVELAGATHPVVYSALASHTPYAEPGFHQTPLIVPTGNYVIADDTARCRGCPRWRTWQRLVDAREQPWYGYGGAWGADGGTPGRTGTSGPSGHRPERP